MARDVRPIRSKLTETLIQIGRVLNVNVDKYSVDVTTEFAKKPFTDISFATPYQHYHGEGIYFMPEVGSMCWICEPSDGGRPFVLAWAAAQYEGDYTANKMTLNPGDIYLGTRDENFMILRRGGVVQIGGGPLSQRIFLPIQNTIRDLCENYSLQSLAGNMVWSIGRTEDTTSGKAPANLILECREYASNKNPVARLTVGSHGSDSAPIMSLIIKASDDDNAEATIDMSMTKAGEITWNVKSDFTFSGKGAYSISVEKELSLKSKGDMTLESQANSMLKAGQEVSIEGGTKVTVKGSSEVGVEAGQIKLGGSAATHNVVWGDVLDLIANHIHPTTAPGAPTLVSPALSGIAAMKSQTVKVS